MDRRIADLLSKYKDDFCNGKNKKETITAESQEWWKAQLLPSCSSLLSITEPPKNQSYEDKAKKSPSKNLKRRRDLATLGFSLVEKDIDQETLIGKLQEGIQRLEDQKLPATFIFLFDEAWELAAAAHRTFDEACHEENQFNFDALAWFIPPGQAGFSPHRDRQPDKVASSFHNDAKCVLQNEPCFVTQWVSLSKATPSNSCLYVIPKDCDPGYLNGDKDDKDPLQVALPDKDAFQYIRAIPREPGESLLFSHRIIHWGSQSDVDHSDGPRVAISFVSSDPKFEAPYLEYDYQPSVCPLIPFELRLLLVCAQLICYQDRFQPSKTTIKACYDYCKEHEASLGPAFRQKVFLEFIKAMEDRRQINCVTYTLGTSSDKKSKGEKEETLGDENENDEDNDDEEDAMMEEMLNAEEDGYGEFQDDFDALKEEDGSAEEVSDDGEDEEEEVDIFGKRALEDGNSDLSKKITLALETKRTRAS